MDRAGGSRTPQIAKIVLRLPLQGDALNGRLISLLRRRLTIALVIGLIRHGNPPGPGQQVSNKDKRLSASLCEDKTKSFATNTLEQTRQ